MRVEPERLGRPPARKFKTPRVFEQSIVLAGATLRQLFVIDLGHDKPTVLLTNDRKASHTALLTRYAQRMLIENALSDAVRFFHMDALSSAVGMKVDFDMALLVVASGLYRLLARRMRGYAEAQARHIFRDLIDTPADVSINDSEVHVHLQLKYQIHAGLIFCLILAGICVGSHAADGEFGSSIDKICSLPSQRDSGLSDDAREVARGRIVLAALTGYAYRSINTLSSKSDVDQDVAQTLEHVTSSIQALAAADAATSQGIFPVYRADYVDELARLAVFATQPAARLARQLDLKQSRGLVVSVVEDDLYLDAYRDACRRLANSPLSDVVREANSRINERCSVLAALSSRTPKPDACVVGAAAPPAPAPAPAPSAPRATSGS